MGAKLRLQLQRSNSGSKYDESQPGRFRSGSSSRRPNFTRSDSSGKDVSESSLRPTDQLARLRAKFILSARKICCVSQALAALVSISVQKLEDCIAQRDINLLRQLLNIGLLVHEVSLLSTWSKEEGMLDDMHNALDALNVTFRLVAGSSESGGPPIEVESVGKKQWGLSLGAVTVTLRITSREDFSWMVESAGSAKSESELSIDARPVLITLGVNELQTMANAQKNATVLQTKINRKALKDLRAYHRSYGEFRLRVGRTSTAVHAVAECNRLLASLEELVELEASGTRRKIVDILLTSASVAQLMNGCRTTSCKSAKDRTVRLRPIYT